MLPIFFFKFVVTRKLRERDRVMSQLKNHFYFKHFWLLHEVKFRINFRYNQNLPKKKHLQCVDVNDTATKCS